MPGIDLVEFGVQHLVGDRFRLKGHYDEFLARPNGSGGWNLEITKGACPYCGNAQQGSRSPSAAAIRTVLKRANEAGYEAYACDGNVAHGASITGQRLEKAKHAAAHR